WLDGATGRPAGAPRHGPAPVTPTPVTPTPVVGALPRVAPGGAVPFEPAPGGVAPDGVGLSAVPLLEPMPLESPWSEVPAPGTLPPLPWLERVAEDDPPSLLAHDCRLTLAREPYILAEPGAEPG